MRVELLYFDGCASWQDGLKNLGIALREEGLAQPVELVKVLDDADAERRQFLGSPSFRVDGQELWPEDRDDFSLSCRVYQSPQGLTRCPTVAVLKEALRPYK
jgi:hypothetical protein